MTPSYFSILAIYCFYRFGTVKNSGVMVFFKQTRIPPFAKMWTQMSELYPDSMVNTTEEGKQTFYL